MHTACQFLVSNNVTQIKATLQGPLSNYQYTWEAKLVIRKLVSKEQTPKRVTILKILHSMTKQQQQQKLCELTCYHRNHFFSEYVPLPDCGLSSWMIMEHKHYLTLMIHYRVLRVYNKTECRGCCLFWLNQSRGSLAFWRQHPAQLFSYPKFHSPKHFLEYCANSIRKRNRESMHSLPSASPAPPRFDW